MIINKIYPSNPLDYDKMKQTQDFSHPAQNTRVQMNFPKYPCVT